MPNDAVLEKNLILVGFLMGNGNDFTFYMPSGGTRIFTGDSAKLLTGKYLNISPSVSITINGNERVLGASPSVVYIPSSKALPDTNKGTFVIILK
jgi:hypothetical protein